MQKDKTKPSGLDYLIILIVFALTGSSAAWIGRQIMPMISIEKGVAYWIVYFLVVTLIYPFLLMSFAFLFGKSTYFWNKQLKMWDWLRGAKKKQESALCKDITTTKFKRNKKTETTCFYLRKSPIFAFQFSGPIAQLVRAPGSADSYRHRWSGFRVRTRSQISFTQMKFFL